MLHFAPASTTKIQTCDYDEREPKVDITSLGLSKTGMLERIHRQEEVKHQLTLPNSDEDDDANGASFRRSSQDQRITEAAVRRVRSTYCQRSYAHQVTVDSSG